MGKLLGRCVYSGIIRVTNGVILIVSFLGHSVFWSMDILKAVWECIARNKVKEYLLGLCRNKIIKNFHPDKNSELEEDIYYHIILANQVLLNKESRKKYDNFIDARKYTHSLGLSTKNEWYDYWKSKKRPTNIPSNPSSTYKKSGWISWADWLGNEWASFKEARSYAVSLRLKSPYAWKKTMKELTSTNKVPKNIPSRPEVTYKNKGWISWEHWLGLKNVM